MAAPSCGGPSPCTSFGGTVVVPYLVQVLGLQLIPQVIMNRLINNKPTGDNE